MKKIGISTWHSIPNHGGMLQMYGLYQILTELGASPSFVLHSKAIEDDSGAPNGLMTKIIRYTHLDSWRQKRNEIQGRTFNTEKIRQMLDFQNHTFQTAEDFSAVDGVCVGSDEVFSVVSGFTPEFFGENYTQPVFSYAGSCGQTTADTVRKKHLEDRISRDFLRFAHISVRDENSADTVEAFTGKRPYIHIDPVLLYGYKEITASVPHNSKQEIILYSYDQNMCRGSEIRAIRRIAKHRDAQILSAGFHHYWCDASMNFEPLDLIREFCACQGVVTDTFHGAVLAIITHSRFTVMVRNQFNSHKIIGLLKLLHLEDRLARNVEDMERVLNLPIDYQQVEIRLDALRTDSLHYLKSCLDEVCP